MKKSFIIILFIVPVAGIMAQDKSFMDFFNKYSSNKDFTQVSVTSKMFDLFTNLESDDPGTKELASAISKLQGLKVLAADSIGDGKKYFTEATNATKGKYEELMSVKNASEDILFQIREANGKISELLMMVGGTHKFFIVSLYGEIDLKQISKLSGAMNIHGLEYLNNVDKNKGKVKTTK